MTDLPNVFSRCFASMAGEFRRYSVVQALQYEPGQRLVDILRHGRL